MDSDAFSISLFVSDFEYIHKNGFTYITLLLFTYTIYQLCILRCLIGYFYNPTKNNRMKKKKKKKKMRSHFHKMITFCLFGKQYMTNKTSIILFLNFFFFNAMYATYRWFFLAIESCEANVLFLDFHFLPLHE